MALHYNYLVEQEGYIQSSYPPSSIETRPDELERSPSFSQIFNFNNRPSFGESDFNGQYRMRQQAPSQGFSKKGGGPHQQRVRFVEHCREEERGRAKKQVDSAGEKTVDRDAGWFIDWKRKSLQTSKTFAD